MCWDKLFSLVVCIANITVIICAYVTSFSCTLLFIYSSGKKKSRDLCVVAMEVQP